MVWLCSPLHESTPITQLSSSYPGLHMCNYVLHKLFLWIQWYAYLWHNYDTHSEVYNNLHEYFTKLYSNA